MRRTGLMVLGAVVAVSLVVLGPLLSPEAEAEAAQATSQTEATSLDLFRLYQSVASQASDEPGAKEGLPLRAQALDDIGTYYDGAGDSSLAEDLAAVTVGYDPLNGNYAFRIEFHDPFVGLTTEHRIGLPIDSDQNASTGYSWGDLGVGSDYGIIIESSDTGCSAGLFRTPSSTGTGWMQVASLETTMNTAQKSIYFELPGSYIGSPASFNMFVCSSWEGLYFAFYDFLPDDGYDVYTRTAVAVETIDPKGPLFSDVSASHSYSVEIAYLASEGIINGFPDGTFRPDAMVTCQQFAKMIVKTLELPVSESDICPFADVPSDVSELDPLYPDKYVAVCAQEGITLGKTATDFGPYDSITRARLITMVSRALHLPDPPLDYVPPFNVYDDTHYPFSRKAAYAGLLAGLQGIGPGYDFYEPATRGEVCLLLFRALQ